jgi:hypothetical protein
MKYLVLICCCLCTAPYAQGQLSSSSVSAGGSSSTIVSYTIGQPIAGNYATTAGELTLGFHPLATGTITSLAESFSRVLVYPNPVIEDLIIQLPDKSIPHSVRMLDFLGRICNAPYSRNENKIHINIKQLPPAKYLLQVKNDALGTSQYFTIVKTTY